MHPFTQQICITTKCFPSWNVTTLSPTPILRHLPLPFSFTPSSFSWCEFPNVKHCGIIYTISMICVVCCVFLFTSLLAFIWCNKWVLHKEKNKELNFKVPWYCVLNKINSLLPEPRGWILIIPFKPILGCSSTTSSTLDFLFHCPMAIMFPILCVPSSIPVCLEWK